MLLMQSVELFLRAVRNETSMCFLFLNLMESGLVMVSMDELLQNVMHYYHVNEINQIVLLLNLEEKSILMLFERMVFGGIKRQSLFDEPQCL